MRASLILSALDIAFATDYLAYNAPTRAPMEMGYQHTAKKRHGHRSRKAAERRRAMQPKRRDYKDRNKKGRP